MEAEDEVLATSMAGSCATLKSSLWQHRLRAWLSNTGRWRACIDWLFICGFGATDPQTSLEKMEAQISRVKEESFSLAENANKAKKWLSACEEGETFYTSTRCHDQVFKRVERACAMVSKIPAMVEALTRKTVAWENERCIEFKYDGFVFSQCLKTMPF